CGNIAWNFSIFRHFRILHYGLARVDNVRHPRHYHLRYVNNLQKCTGKLNEMKRKIRLNTDFLSFFTKSRIFFVKNTCIYE
ncbi:MAG: hypothetical protein II227_00865, partial [Clostridia bacterium]|nr:hypothetical protein [Clostridia bacterium]